MNHQGAGKRMNRRGSKSIPFSNTVIGEGRRLTIDRVTDQKFNDPYSDYTSIKSDENYDSLMKTFRPYLEVDLVVNERIIGF